MLNVLSSGLFLKFLPVILSGVCWVFVFGGGYWMGCNATKQKYTIEEQAKEIEYQSRINSLVDQVRSQEIANQSRINDIISNHLNSEEAIRNEYEKIISDLRDNRYVIANSVQYNNANKCTDERVSSTARDTSELICYTKGELYGKIESSLAIAKECDEIASRYNSLLDFVHITNTTTTTNTANTTKATKATNAR